MGITVEFQGFTRDHDKTSLIPNQTIAIIDGQEITPIAAAVSAARANNRGITKPQADIVAATSAASLATYVTDIARDKQVESLEVVVRRGTGTQFQVDMKPAEPFSDPQAAAKYERFLGEMKATLPRGSAKSEGNQLTIEVAERARMEVLRKLENVASRY